MIERLPRLWYSRSPMARLLLAPLLPLSLGFCALARYRRFAYRRGLKPSAHPGVPVVVVGNLSVGGAGKTPVTAWLYDFLRRRGRRPGIISRGYGGRAAAWPQRVYPDSDPVQVGDEPVLLARRTGGPIAVGPDRLAAARALVEPGLCDLLISDDGLQHYALQRDLELAIIDGARRHGNGWCLPAGPLREPVSRLESVDLTLNNGGARPGEYGVRLRGDRAVNLLNPEQTRPLEAFADLRIHAVAAIGHPERFFVHLRRHGVRAISHPFPDHHPFTPQDLDFPDAEAVLMTEKDAVKCAAFAEDRYWQAPVDLEVDAALEARLDVWLDCLQGASKNSH